MARGPTILSAIVCTAALLGGCGGGEGDRAAPAPPPAPAADTASGVEPAPTATSTAEATLIKSGLHFEPAFSFTALNPDYEILFQDMGSLAVAFIDPSGEIGVIDEQMEFLDPEAEHNRSDFTPVEVSRDVESIAAWLQAHPRLKATEPQPLTVGGADGLVVDVEATEVYETDSCPVEVSADEIKTLECVVLFDVPGGLIVLSEANKLRLIVLDVDGESIIVTVEATKEDFDEFAAAAEEMLATLSFG